MKNKKISRRKFIGSTAAAATAFTIVPRHVLGGAGYKPPSEKLNVAGVGVGGIGMDNILNVAGMEYDEESVVMGNLAVRYPNKKLELDGEKMEVTNFPEANQLINPPYRQGWSL